MEYVVGAQSVVHPLMCVITSNIVVYVISELFHRYEEEIIRNRFVDYTVLILVSSCVMMSCSDALIFALRTNNPIAAAGSIAVTLAVFGLAVHFIVEDSLTIETYFTLGRLFLGLLNLGCVLVIASAFSNCLMMFLALHSVMADYYGGETDDVRLQTEGQAGMVLLIIYSCLMYPCVDIIYVYIMHFAQCVLLVMHRVPPIWSPLFLAALGMKCLSISLQPHVLALEPHVLALEPLELALEPLELALMQNQETMQNITQF